MEQVYKRIRVQMFKNAFLALVCVGILNIIAVKLYFYWTLQYYDSIVHFLAGMSVGFACLWILMHKTTSGKNILLTALVASFSVGIIWELFELYIRVVSFSDGIHYITDTASDLLMDVLGGLIAGLHARRLLSSAQNNTL